MHIDTYQMFTGDSFIEREVEYLCEQHDDSTLTYDDFDWEFDHKAIVEAFAKASIEAILQAVAYEKPEIVKSIEFVSSASPKFYNYTTDSYVMTVDVHTPNLNDYIAKHYDAVHERARGYGTSFEDVTPENLAHAGLCHYIDSLVVADDYNYTLWEIEHEVYSENCKVTPRDTVAK